LAEGGGIYHRRYRPGNTCSAAPGGLNAKPLPDATRGPGCGRRVWLRKGPGRRVRWSPPAGLPGPVPRRRTKR